MTSFSEIITVILPIFKYKPLLTYKFFDFYYFSSAADIKLNSKTFKEIDLNSIIKIKEHMKTLNNDRDIKSIHKILNLKISAQWLLGFVEAEGTFGIKNLTPYFQIAQHKKSVYTLDLIKQYLSNLPKVNKETIYAKIPNTGISINSKTNVYSYVITDIDILYDFIMPFFDSLEILSRKFVDFKYWSVVVKLHKLCYFYLPEGRKITLCISNYINKNRYSNNVNRVLETPDSNSIDLLFSTKPPVDISTGLNHEELSKLVTRNLGGRSGFLVYIYKQDQIIKGSPFKSYGEAQKAIGLNSNSRAISRNIDTGKLYKNIYLFTSHPLNN